MDSNVDSHEATMQNILISWLSENINQDDHRILDDQQRQALQQGAQQRQLSHPPHLIRHPDVASPTPGQQFPNSPLNQYLPEQTIRTSHFTSTRLPNSTYGRHSDLDEVNSNIPTTAHATPHIHPRIVIDHSTTATKNISMGVQPAQSTNNHVKPASTAPTYQQRQPETNREQQPAANAVAAEQNLNRIGAVSKYKYSPSSSNERSQPGISHNSARVTMDPHNGPHSINALHLSPAPSLQHQKSVASSDQGLQGAGFKRLATTASSEQLRSSSYRTCNWIDAPTNSNAATSNASRPTYLSPQQLWEQQQAQQARQNELQEQILLAEEQRVQKERSMKRKDALKKDPSALYRYYNEFLEYFPLQPGEHRNPYLSKLLANQRIPVDETIDLAIAISYAKEHWEAYLEYPRDISRAVGYSKEREERLQANLRH